MAITIDPTPDARFPLGTVLVTPGGARLLEEAGVPAAEFLARHAVGDWGDVPAGFTAANDQALMEGGALMSRYTLASGKQVSVVTSTDRQVTVIHQWHGSSATETPRPRFPLGRLMATPGAIRLCESLGVEIASYVFRHGQGDWGDLGEEDRAENELSLKAGFRLLSAYALPGDERLWIITEADRSVTTALLPEEY